MKASFPPPTMPIRSFRLSIVILNRLKNSKNQIRK
jgi:hypothetical protein